jgi:uracil-DNA glycosylase
MSINNNNLNADLKDNRLKHSLSISFDSIAPSWREITDAFEQGRQALIKRVDAAAPNVAPADPFRFLRYAEPDQVRVVLIGQDPYPKLGQAQGMAFSCSTSVPHSMGRSVFPALKAVKPDFVPPQFPHKHADLTPWAKQGVLLLNTVLTVEVGRAGSHLNIGWQSFTALIVRALLERANPPYFLLWGSQAQGFFEACAEGLPLDAHRVLRARHPSNDFKKQFVAQAKEHFEILRRVYPDLDWWALGD